MNHYFERATVLYEQSRFALAAKEYLAALSEDSQNIEALAMLAICRAQEGKYDEATRAAQSALELAPDCAAGYYAHSVVLRLRFQSAAALEAIREAIRLQPDNTEYICAQAQAYFQSQRYDEALQAIERACELDPSKTRIVNLKALFLLVANRTAEADAIMRAELARSPDDAFTHANCGWVYLEGRRPKKALHFFREALRIDPTFAWARAGMLEAMRASYSFYRWPLLLLQLLLRLPPAFIVISYVALLMSLAILEELRQKLPEHSLQWQTLMAIVVVVLIVAWVANPLMNLLLSCNRSGRCLLTNDDRIASYVVGGMAALAIAFFACGLTLRIPWSLTAALFSALSMPAVASIFNYRPIGPRVSMLAMAALIIALGMGVVWQDFAAQKDAQPVKSPPLREYLLIGFSILFCFNQIVVLGQPGARK